MYITLKYKYENYYYIFILYAVYINKTANYKIVCTCNVN